MSCELDLSTATDPTNQDEVCPGCGATDQVRSTGSTLNTEAWACDGCGMGWAVSLINRHLLPRPSDYAEQIGAARWLLGQVVALADEAPTLTDRELRHRLLALADGATLVNPQRPI